MTLHQFADFDGDAQTAIVAAPDRLGQKVVARFLEPRERADFLDAPLHVAVAGFPIISLGAMRLQLGVGHKEASGFHIGDKCAAGVEAGKIAGHDDAHLVGENLLALIVDHAAAVAVAVKPQREIGAGGAD
jgi:hypothetical protein